MNQIVTQGGVYGARLAGFLQAYIGQQSGHHVSYEWLVVMFFIFSVFLITVTLGRSKMLVALLSVYAAALIQDRFVFFDDIERLFKNRPSFMIDIGLFIVLYILVFMLMSKIINNSRVSSRESSLLMILPIALLQAGLLASILLPYLPDASGVAVIDQFRDYFVSKNSQFWWAVAPLITLLFIRFKKEKRRSS